MIKHYGLYKSNGDSGIVGSAKDYEMVQLLSIFHHPLDEKRIEDVITKSKRIIPNNFYVQMTPDAIRKELAKRRGKESRLKLRPDRYESICMDESEVFEEIALEELLSSLPEKISD